MNYLQTIQEYLKRNVTTHKRISTWRDFEVFIVDNLIFRFPKKKEKIIDLHKEKQKIDILKPYISLAIPEYTVVNNMFIVYPLLPGEPLKQVESSYNDSTIKQLSEFMCQLHSIPKELFEQNIQTSPADTDDELTSFLEVLHQNLDKKLSSHISPQALIWIHRYIQELFFSFSSPLTSFVHTDLQGKNILHIDSNVSWIIDFTDSRIGSTELDFCYFYDINQDILWKALD